MTRIGLLSRSEPFHRLVWDAAKKRPSVSIVLRMRSERELTGVGGLDVLILLEPDIAWLSGNSDLLDEVPVLAVLTDANGGDATAVRGLLGRDGAVVERGLDGDRILVAAESVTAGFLLQEGGAMEDGEKSAQATAESAANNALTPRELEVLRLLAAGKSNPQIAQALDISENTVKYHLAGLYGALDVRSRSAAVVSGIRRGLISI